MGLAANLFRLSRSEAGTEISADPDRHHAAGRPRPPRTRAQDDAKLQAMGYEAYLYEPAAGGHGYGKDNKERAAFTALGYAFLKSKIGWTDDRA